MAEVPALQRVVTGLAEGARLRNELASRSAASIVEAARMITDALQAGGKVLLFGNGGSAADAQHIAAELVGRYLIERRALAALCLTGNPSIVSAIGNDYGFEQVFARQVEALGRPGDVAFGLSTSGNSPNVLAAMRAAAVAGMRTIGLSGRDGGELARAVDLAITVPSASTPRIQECHIAIGHLICELVERELAGPQA